MERKALLGAVFDEIEHHFKLFTRERNIYLALAVVAGVTMVVASVVLIMQPFAAPAVAVAVLGGSGLVAFAAARSAAFFHSTIRMSEELVKRYSKLSEPEVVSSLAAMHKKSETSMLLLAAAGAAVLGSVVFALVGVGKIQGAVEQAQLETARVQGEASRWKHSFSGVQKAYASLKAGVTSLYPALVTPTHGVVDVRATGQKAASGFSFTLALHSAPATLASIKRVRYLVRYPGVADQELVAEDATKGFAVSYVGPGCLSHIDVALELADNSKSTLSIDQCRVLGSTWVPVAAPEPARPTA